MKLAAAWWTAALASQATAQDIVYDETWAGPVRVAERFNGTSGGFDRVEAVLVMPELAIPDKPREQVDEYTAAYWIGLSGFLPTSVTNGLWQAGVIMSIWANGSTEYKGFYEWIPLDPVGVNSTELAISAGDYVYVAISTTNEGLVGTVEMTNLNTSQTFLHSEDAPTTWRGPTWPSLGNTAEWIVEAGTYLNGPRYVFPDWGNATFLEAKACYDGGQDCFAPVSPDNSTLNRMTAVLSNDTQTLYTRSFVDEGTVTIEYIEEPFNG